MSVNSHDDRVVISEGVFHEGTFGAYVVPAGNASSEYHLIGGCKSTEDARRRVLELVEGIPSKESLEYRERPSIQIDNSMRMLSEKELKDSLGTHIDSLTPRLFELSLVSDVRATIWKILKALFSYHNAVLLLTALAIFVFWDRSSIVIPNDIDLPLVGNRLGGTTLNATTLARYFPIILLGLYLSIFLHMLRTNLQYDVIRRQILALIFLHRWRAPNFIQLIQTRMMTGGFAWLASVLEWAVEKDPASLHEMRKLAELSAPKAGLVNPRPQEVAEESRTPLPPKGARAELDEENLKHWLTNDFEKRVHNLLFLDKEKDYSRFVICFDPLIYLTSTNRVVFRAYELLRRNGVKVDQYNAPRDPYQVERLAPSLFWCSEAFRMALLGSSMIWSFAVAEHQLEAVLIADILAAFLVLSVPSWWNYLAVIKKRGFPKAEPLGAYTVGFVTNRLSIM